MRYTLFIYAILFSVLTACAPTSIEEEKRKLSNLETSIKEQQDSLNAISKADLLQIEDSIQSLSKQFQINQHDSIGLVFSTQMLRNFEHMGTRFEYLRNYRDTLQQELHFSEQQIQHLRADLENRVWDKEQFHIYYVQETRSIHNNAKQIAENNKRIRNEINQYAEYEKKIRVAINDQKNDLSSAKTKAKK